MGTYLVTHKMKMLGQEMRNTFYYVTSVGEPSDSEWQDVCDEIRVDYIDAGVSTYSENFSWYGIDRRRVDTAGLLTFSEVPTLGAFVGTATANEVPTQVCLLVSNKGTTTKPNRARSYLGGFVESLLTDGLWEAAIRAIAETLIDFQSALNAGGTNPMTRVAAQWNASHTFVTATNDISGAASFASEVPATQRRRRIGRGI